MIIQTSCNAPYTFFAAAFILTTTYYWKLFRIWIGCDCFKKKFTEVTIAIGARRKFSFLGFWNESLFWIWKYKLWRLSWTMWLDDPTIESFPDGAHGFFWLSWINVSAVQSVFLIVLKILSTFWLLWLGWMCLLALLALSAVLFLSVFQHVLYTFIIVFIILKTFLAFLDECVCWLCWLPELCVFCSTGEHYSYNHRGHLFHWIVTKQTMVIFAYVF